MFSDDFIEKLFHNDKTNDVPVLFVIQIMMAIHVNEKRRIKSPLFSWKT